MSNSGADNLKKIKSIKCSGITKGEKDEDVPMTMYVSKDVYYVSVKASNIQILEVYDGMNNKAWLSLGGRSEDLTGDYKATMKIMMETELWKYYYNADEQGISYKLLNDTVIRETDCYALEINDKSGLIEIDYFDKKNYNKIRQEAGTEGVTNDYSDYRKAGDTGIDMPYKLFNKIGEFTITGYEFNKSFNKKLLTKP